MISIKPRCIVLEEWMHSYIISATVFMSRQADPPDYDKS